MVGVHNGDVETEFFRHRGKLCLYRVCYVVRAQGGGGDYDKGLIAESDTGGAKIVYLGQNRPSHVRGLIPGLNAGGKGCCFAGVSNALVPGRDILFMTARAMHSQGGDLFGVELFTE